MSELILHHYPTSPFAEKARLLLGWTPLVRNAVRAQALKGLKAFQASR